MSGICGLVDFAGSIDPETLGLAAAAAAHRAPDGIHTWVDGGVGLAHLAMVLAPESVGERQPLHSDSDLVLVADARIDNRVELIRLLCRQGGRPPSDAELILSAYQRWGARCPEWLLGDFAFAVWDGRRQRLFAARDAMGIRTFHYHLGVRRAAFGSEAKQVLATRWMPRRYFEPALAAHLLGRPPPPEWTFFEGVSALAPGHALLVDDGGYRVWSFWAFDLERRLSHSSPGAYAEEFRSLFTDAVRSRLRCVKPVGISLSGGMDSVSVAATAGLLQRQAGGMLAPALRAYCWAFSELTECDERDVSGPLADHYGIDVMEIPADDGWPLREFPAHGPDSDDPGLGPYQVLWERSIAAARNDGVGLMLTGAFGDLLVGEEVFDDAGLFMSGRWRILGAELSAHRRQYGGSLVRTLASRLGRPAIARLWSPRWAQQLRSEVLHGKRTAAAWVSPNLLHRMHFVRAEPTGGWRRADYARLERARLISDHADDATHWARIHARRGMGYADPWADRRLVEFVVATPQWIVQQRSNRKAIARAAMADIVPDTVLTTTRKRSLEPLGYPALRVHERATIIKLLTCTRGAAYGYFDEDILRAHYQSFCHGAPIAIGPFWNTLTLELWLRAQANHEISTGSKRLIDHRLFVP